MIEQIFDKDVFKIFSMFSLSPGSRFTRNEIKEKTRLNNVPLDNALLRSLASRIIKRENGFYQINFENENSKKILEIIARQYKNWKELPFDVYMLLIDLVDQLSLIKDIEVYLFGSYSKLIYHEDSDVDIAIVYKKPVDKIDLMKIKNKLEKKYGKIVEVHDFEKSSFYRNKKEPLVKEILKNGIRLI